MRTFSTNVQNVLDGETIQFFYLIKLEFSSDYFFTSYNSDIPYDGDTYLSDGGLVEFDSPSLNSVVDREAYKIVIADQVNEMLSEFRLGVVGKVIEVRVGFLDSNGVPMTDPEDVILIYRGFVDSPSVSNDFEQKLAIIEGTSPMSDLDAINDFISSKDGMDQVSATDTSFDSIFKDNEVLIKWGKV
jgi:hypothetical protein